MYEMLKSNVPEENKKSILVRLTCGAFAGLFGQTLTYPLDVVKRQMQVCQHNSVSPVENFYILVVCVCGLKFDSRGLMLLPI